MDLFGSEDSRDELGLGSIRDALADLLFPATSTIQTRLRYMLLAPWIYKKALKDRPPAVRKDYARALEIRLIEALVRGGETSGVIGSTVREKLKRLPSDVYWAARWVCAGPRRTGTPALKSPRQDASRLGAAGLPNDFLRKAMIERPTLQ